MFKTAFTVTKDMKFQYTLCRFPYSYRDLTTLILP